MPARCRRSTILAITALLLPGAALAADPAGRARVWEFGLTAGASVLDGGFNAGRLGYTVPRADVVPPVRPDNLDATVPSIGFRVGYNFVRWFGLEVSAATGTTSVGKNSVFLLKEDFTLPTVQLRRKRLKEQTQTVPGIERALESINYDTSVASAVAVFNLNNRLESRFAYYMTIGGGYYALNADTGSFNDCLDAASTRVRFADNPSLAGDVNGDGRVEFPERVDDFDVDQNGIDENGQRIDSFDIGCARAFPTARLQGTTFAGQDIFWVGKAQFQGGNAPPGTLNNSGIRTVNPIHNVDGWTWVLGGGVRWHIRPRQIVRADVKRHFDESQNKNINEFSVGYSFMVGRGHATASAPAGSDAAPAPPPEPKPTEG